MTRHFLAMHAGIAILFLSTLTGWAAGSGQDSSQTLDSNVVALWHFDEGSGTFLHDASIYHNDGQIHNCRWVKGRFGSALHFDGYSSYVILPNSPSLQTSPAFTIEAWISLDRLSFDRERNSNYGSAAIVSNIGRYPCGGGYDLGIISPGKLVFDDRTENCISNMSTRTTLHSSHRFYHVACVYLQSTVGIRSIGRVTMYVNGIRTASSSFRGPIQYANTPSFYIGTNMDGRAVGGGGVREFPGIIDEIRITKVALDPSEFHIPPEKSGEATRKRERVSGDAFSVDLLPQQSRIVLDGKVGILNSHSPGSSTPKIKFKGIFGLARNSGGPFEDNSIAVATGDDFFLQVASGLYYEVFVKSATVQGVKLKFSKMLKRK